MEITGQIIAMPEARTGKSDKGDWKCQPYVIEESEGQYPKKVCFEVFGEDKIKLFNLQIGGYYKVSYDIDAREYKGKWFNSIRAWKVESAATPTSAVQQAKEEPKAAPVDFTPDKNEGELPF